jgi:hypothetical protein
MPAQRKSFYRARGVQQGKCQRARILRTLTANPYEHWVFTRKLPKAHFRFDEFYSTIDVAFISP